MVPPAGHVGTQLSRENFETRRFGAAERASVNMRRHCAALLLCAAAACFMVQRWGSSVVGHFRCGRERLSYLRRLLCRCAKMAAMVRPLPYSPGAWARHARGSRCERMSWFM